MSTVLVVASAVCEAANRWIDVISISLALASQIGGQLFFLLQDERALLVGQFLVEPLQQPPLGFFGAQAADLVQRLPLDVEQVVELRLPAVGVFQLFGQLALVVLDHLLLFLQLVGPLLDQVLLLVEMALAFEILLPGFVELLLDAGLFLRASSLASTSASLRRAGLDFGLFEDLLGFFFGVALAQIAQQLDDAHAHDGGNDRDDYHNATDWCRCFEHTIFTNGEAASLSFNSVTGSVVLFCARKSLIRPAQILRAVSLSPVN